MLKLLQHPTSVIDADGNVVDTTELMLQGFILAAKRARLAHEMVLYSACYPSTEEVKQYWLAARARARAEAHRYALDYRMRRVLPAVTFQEVFGA